MKRFLTDYGMLLALAALCLLLSWLTWDEQHPTGITGGRQVARAVLRVCPAGSHVVLIGGSAAEDRQFADTLAGGLKARGIHVADVVLGSPVDARRLLERIAASRTEVRAIACSHAAGQWPLTRRIAEQWPALASAQVIRPESYFWPNFLKRENLRNVAHQIVVIAVVAIGMTMVIITAGIDLSVGSLIALAAVVATLLIRDYAGGESARPLGMVVCCLAAILLCAAVGTFSGVMVTCFAIPPFIVTLGMMLVASGLAYILAEGHSVYQVPESFVWLGRGTTFLGIPNSVVLMIGLYVVAHILMSHTALGRYIYAVGGNAEAARLSGVPLRGVLLFVYTVSGALAGLGGIVTASQLKSGSPTYGMMLELYVIAAVVVGGTSLSGGQGKVFGTLIGALIIAVIQNGMNLTGVESYTQKVVLGLVILGAVLFDNVKQRGFRLLTRQAGVVR